MSSPLSTILWSNNYDRVQPWIQWLGYLPAVALTVLNPAAVWVAVGLAVLWCAVVVAVTVWRRQRRFQVPTALVLHNAERELVYRTLNALEANSYFDAVAARTRQHLPIGA